MISRPCPERVKHVDPAVDRAIVNVRNLFHAVIMFCPRCGSQHPDEASFCPSCGEWLGPSEPGPAPYRPRLSLTGALGDAAAALFTRRAGAAYPLLVVTWLLSAVAFAAAAVVTILAGFGTIWPRRIFNTSCFVETDQPGGYVVSRPGGSTTYWHRLPNCDVTRIDPNWGMIVVVGVLMFALVVLVSAIAWAMTYRIAAHVIDGDRPTLPSPGAIMRAAGRVLGWGAVLAACWLGGWLLFVVAGVVLVGVAGPIGVLIMIGLVIYLGIWWVVPLFTRATLAFALMIVDDARFPDCWAVCDVTLGQAWGYLGLTVAASIGFSIISQVVDAFGSQGGGWLVVAIIVTAALYLIQYLFFAVYAVIVAHGLSAQHTRSPSTA
jgi:hypothetical protein